MATVLTNSTFATTYKDDYADSDGYYRILFNSGKALQARELTQAQTIIQKQIERFGNNIFKEGGVVKPGSVSINVKYQFVKLNTTVNALPSNPSSLVGRSFTGQTSGVIAKILEVVEAEGSDPATFYVQYIDTLSSSAATTSSITFDAGENISDGSNTLTVQTTNTASNPAMGFGTKFAIDQGVYFTRGHFVFTQDQSKIVSKYTDFPSANVGYKVIEDVVTIADNNALYDNQGSTPNLSSPGADRYRIRLVLASQDEIDSDENFIQVAAIVDGAISSIAEPTDDYAVPRDMIAQRIQENSGDYIVKPFKVKFEEDSDNNYLILATSDGIAVVDGYRAASYSPIRTRVKKPTATITENNEAAVVSYGNYVKVSSADGETSGLPNIDDFDKLNIRTSADYGGSTIGTCRVRAVTEDGSNYRYHLFDIQMNSGQAFRNGVSIGNSSSDYFNIIQEGGVSVLYEQSKNNLLFNLPRQRPSSLTDILLDVQRRKTVTTDGSGAGTISLTAAGETFTNTNDWVFAKADSSIFTGSVSITNNGASADLSGLPASSTVEVLSYVRKGSGTVRSKTLKDASVIGTIDSDGNGTKYISLNKTDIFNLTQVVDATDSSVDYFNRFFLDNGQRDNYYDVGRILLKSGTTAPAGNVYAKFKHFQHGSTGDFFAVNSYTGQIPYNQIPTYRALNGNLYYLRNALDFRSVKDTSGEFSSAVTGARVNELPQPNDTLSLDATYYVAKSGKLTINTDGEIQYIDGETGYFPPYPPKPENSLGLYNILLHPNTLNDSDVTIKKIESKRYTMKDIDHLSSRVDKLEEVTSLALLELDTKSFEVLDSSGNNRTKSGFFVDNFATHNFSNVRTNDYRASIDPYALELRPYHGEDNIRLLYDSDESTNVIRKGDNVYIAYDNEEYISQTLATKSIKINPFAVVVHEGITVLSPASDEWRDVYKLADRIIDGGTKLDTTQAYLWNNWEWNWGGKAIDQLTVGSETNVKTEDTASQYIARINRVVSEETIKEVVGSRVLDIALLPYIRSRKISFKASGLRPNSKLFAFFDGKDVSDWVNNDTFEFFGTTTVDYGDTLNGSTQHPDGAATLETDANGEVEGSFWIPNNNILRFRAGVREFTLLDISVYRPNEAISIARGLYTCQGYLDTVQDDVLSTRMLYVEGDKTVKNKPRYHVQQDGGGGNYNAGLTFADFGSWLDAISTPGIQGGDPNKGQSPYDKDSPSDTGSNTNSGSNFGGSIGNFGNTGNMFA